MIIVLSENRFLQAIKENQGIIYKLVGLYAQDEEEKKDFYQEVLLQAWKSWPSFRGDAAFSTWLYRICLNTILTQKRKNKPVEYAADLEQVSPVVQHSSIKMEDSALLQMAIRKLPETDRAIISLHLDGYQNHEIAGIIGISTNHIAVKIHRCKQQLAQVLKQ